MRGILFLALLSSALAAGCDRIGLGPHRAASAPNEAPEARAAPDLRPYAGATLAEFLAAPGMDSYAPAALGLSEAEAARLAAAMAAPAPAMLTSGGGAEAIVFSGCAAGGCAEGRGVVAIDLETGAAFVAVRDAAGEAAFRPNPRVEALLRLTSPTQRWDDPAPAPIVAAGP
ncbi:MAG: hypothetical protein AB7Q23_07610 [Hyphomonadaceae bacterium]